MRIDDDVSALGRSVGVDRSSSEKPAMGRKYGWALMCGAILLAPVAASPAGAQPAFASTLRLAPNVQPANDLVPPKTKYVVANEAQIYRTPVYNPDQATGEVVRRGERPEVLGEANGGNSLLIGRNGQGVGYVSRGLMCPADLCPDIRS